VDRRKFLKISLGTTIGLSALAVSGISLKIFEESDSIALPDMRLDWHKWMTKRPWAPDIDFKGRLWYGRDKFFCSDLEKHTTEIIDNSYMEGKEYSHCFCYGDKVYIVSQKSPYLYMYNQETGTYSKFELPDPESNIWFGRRVPGDSRLYLYVRNRNHMVIWHTEKEKGEVVRYPDNTDLWSGFYIPSDEAIYSFTLDAKPARLIRFDTKKQKFDAVINAPETGLEITGVNPIGNKVYCSDRFTGRIFPYNIVNRTWGDPVTAPGIGKEYGFLGMGCVYNDLALYSLSTYKGSMRWDFNKNDYLSKDDEDIGVDGKKHHFMNQYLVYDPQNNAFGYLKAEAGGRYPLICYSIVNNNSLIITGCDIMNHEMNIPDMEKEGELFVFRSV